MRKGLKPTNNLQHNVPALLERGRGSLKALAGAYFVAEVAGQAPGTIEAKRRDLTRFLAFYVKLYGHDRTLSAEPRRTLGDDWDRPATACGIL
jgi:hypothetical protein